MADLSQTIEKFYTQAVDIDFARKHQWRITEITKQLGETIGGTDALPYIYAQTGELPGREITNVAVNFHGLDFNLPGNAKYTNSSGYTVTWRLDQALNIRRMFEDWNIEVFDHISTTGQIIRNDQSQMIMQLYSQDGSVTDTYILHGLYPVSVGPVQYDIGTDGEIQTFDTTFAYHYFRRETDNGHDASVDSYYNPGSDGTSALGAG